MSAGVIVEALNNRRDEARTTSKARERLALLFDAGSYRELDMFVKIDGRGAGVVTGYGTVDSVPVYAFSQDISEAKGAVGRQHAAKIKKVYELAAKTGCPVVGVYDSFGARLTEGPDALAAYGEMLLASANLSGVVPQISVVAGTCAGTAAMLALSADFVVMSEKGEMFLSPAAAKTAGGAEAALKSGAVHLVAKDDAEAMSCARRLVSMLPQNNLSDIPAFEFAPPKDVVELELAADAEALIKAVFDEDSAIELSEGFGKSAFTGLATLGGVTCGVVATSGKPLCKNALSKIAKLVSVCDSFQVPVITFVNAPGIESSAESEAAGMLRSAAVAANVYADSTTTKIAVITGEAYGPAYIALAGRCANADLTYAWPSAVISALPPEAAVVIMKDGEISRDKPREQVVEEYRLSDASPFAAAESGYIEDIIEPRTTRDMLLSALDILSGKRVSKMPKKHSNLPL